MNRKLLATAICASLLVAGAAYAQNDPAQQDQSSGDQSSSQQQEKKTLETVTVSGTLLKRPEYQTNVPVQVVPIQADMAAGQFNVTNFVQTTAAAAGSTQINGQFGGFVIEGGTGVQPVDLRGLGAQRTLVLLDGQRPGPAGTRGQVNNFDLNVIPSAIIGRIEIVKDGSSSIYGSDAIAGVVNLITKKRLDKTELDFFTSVPAHGGGQQYSASIATGWNFDKGNITFAAQAQRQQALTVGDRSFLRCSRPMVWGPDGNRVDWQDHSINEGTKLAGCQDMLVQTLINGFSGLRYVPSKDGSTGPGVPVPGYVLSQRKQYNQVTDPKDAFNDQPDSFSQYASSSAIDRNQTATLYVAPSFQFGSVNWDTQLILNRRTTNDNQWRQFFPLVTNDNGWSSGNQALAYDIYYATGKFEAWEPIMLFPMNQKITVDYGYLRTGLNGGFGDSSWSWAANAEYSRSNGDYDSVGINLLQSGDWSRPGTGPDGRTELNYFDPGYMNGSKMNELVATIGQPTHGNTLYKQQDVNVVVNGNVFDLPAGAIEVALGGEYRHFSLNDTPPPETWGLTSAGNTRGADHVTEFYGEAGIPILKGMTLAKSLDATASYRTFKYASVGSSSHVWKYGINWAPFDTFRIRGNIGTSYRAPALYELYLANQTGFVSQLSVDPCILWGESSNQFIQTNCAAAGIPSTYTGTGASAMLTQGGGKGFLKPETSRAKTLGFVWSPAFANLQLAVDYFDYHIRGEIASLSGGTIVTSCYNKPVFPNDFCNMFERNPGTGPNPYNITDVHATYVNVNQERDRGYDFQANFAQDFGFGRLTVDAEVTYTMEHVQQIFSSSAASGFDASQFAGTIGNPKWVGIANVALKRGDWSYNWQGFYTAHTSDARFEDPVFTYLGMPDVTEKITQKAQLRHSVSATYDQGALAITFGIRNLFDQKPPLVSNTIGTENVVGNVPLQATQYDWFGRTFFARLNIKI